MFLKECCSNGWDATKAAITTGYNKRPISKSTLVHIKFRSSPLLVAVVWASCFLKISIFYFHSNEHSQNHNSRTNKYPTQSTHQKHVKPPFLFIIQFIIKGAIITLPPTAPINIQFNTSGKHSYVFQLHYSI